MTIRRPLTRIQALGLYYAALATWLFTTAMHIPDGYLSPATSLVMFLLVLPFWVIGIRKIRLSMDARSVPLIALLAAFSFVVMLFNIPLPGGTTGHAIGATLAAIVLGPEVAVIACSIALIIQALFFGDGGILAIGANCFNMAVIVPYVGYAVYSSLSKNSALSSPRRFIAAALGGWVGLSVAAFFAGVEFGLQPLLFHTASGAPLYAPYPLSVAVPAMLLPHMLVASPIEGLLTALVFAFFQRSNVVSLAGAEKAAQAAPKPRLRWVWVGLAVLAVASPLGLLAPGTAWGEWGTAQLTAMGLQSIPQGLSSLSGLWGAPLAGYNLPVLGNANLGYLVSAVAGIVIVAIVVWLFTRLLTTRPGAPRQDR